MVNKATLIGFRRGDCPNRPPLDPPLVVVLMVQIMSAARTCKGFRSVFNIFDSFTPVAYKVFDNLMTWPRKKSDFQLIGINFLLF